MICQIFLENYLIFYQNIKDKKNKQKIREDSYDNLNWKAIYQALPAFTLRWAEWHGSWGAPAHVVAKKGAWLGLQGRLLKRVG